MIEIEETGKCACDECWIRILEDIEQYRKEQNGTRSTTKV